MLYPNLFYNKACYKGTVIFLPAHLLLIVLSMGCKVFISASLRMQWFCRLVMKNSVLI